MKGIQSMALKEKIFSKTKVDETTGCRLWQESLNPDGYALLRHKGKKRSVHRISYEEFVGPIPSGLFVLHKCDVRHCCAPTHLFLGTYSDNAKDAVGKGRQKNLFKSGSEHPRWNPNK